MGSFLIKNVYRKKCQGLRGGNSCSHGFGSCYCYRQPGHDTNDKLVKKKKTNSMTS